MTHPNGHGKLKRANTPEAREWWDKVIQSAKPEVKVPEETLTRIRDLAHVIEYGSPRASAHARKIRELIEEIQK